MISGTATIVISTSSGKLIGTEVIISRFSSFRVNALYHCASSQI
jgi:hypothetical protein